jgi:hypothetical protein
MGQYYVSLKQQASEGEGGNVPIQLKNIESEWLHQLKLCSQRNVTGAHNKHETLNTTACIFNFCAYYMSVKEIMSVWVHTEHVHVNALKKTDAYYRFTYE